MHDEFHDTCPICDESDILQGLSTSEQVFLAHALETDAAGICRDCKAALTTVLHPVYDATGRGNDDD